MNRRVKQLVKWKKRPPETFVYNDGGRHFSKRPTEDNDCTVRALALGLNMSYDEAYNLLQKHGRLENNGYIIEQLLRDYCKTCKLTKISFPTRKGYRRMHMAAFCHIYPTGVYLLKSHQHISTCIDGMIHDLWWSPDEVVYCAYKINR